MLVAPVMLAGTENVIPTRAGRAWIPQAQGVSPVTFIERFTSSSMSSARANPNSLALSSPVH